MGSVHVPRCSKSAPLSPPPARLGLFSWPQGLRPEWRQYDRGVLVASRTLLDSVPPPAGPAPLQHAGSGGAAASGDTAASAGAAGVMSPAWLSGGGSGLSASHYQSLGAVSSAAAGTGAAASGDCACSEEGGTGTGRGGDPCLLPHPLSPPPAASAPVAALDGDEVTVPVLQASRGAPQRPCASTDAARSRPSFPPAVHVAYPGWRVAPRDSACARGRGRRGGHCSAAAAAPRSAATVVVAAAVAPRAAQRLCAAPAQARAHYGPAGRQGR